ncbi:hypothetical protein BRADI_1g69840v3 [Brachypodium distachyon]|uniref:Tryptophan synthase beta chain-like PALP domain-containing protein n=1 Tax=Brachypodium distachyon TaxID=15368 RepID=A0A2K2DUB5_BRADI|nr:hypothetical protein BRADI_1g69840v3 [Brachypodium distachyon]
MVPHDRRERPEDEAEGPCGGHRQHASHPHQQPLRRHRLRDSGKGRVSEPGRQREGPRGSKDHRGVTEGSAGSTAISLATVAPAYGCRCHVVIPDDAAVEKSQIIEALGAIVERVRPVSITHRDHFVNIARRRALEANIASTQIESNDRQTNGSAYVKTKMLHTKQTNGSAHANTELSSTGKYCPISDSKGGFFADQFENLANYRAHYEWTGPEIWEQTKGTIHAFVAAAGTGGTIAGVSRYLKEKNRNVQCFLMDPPGSGLFNKVTRGVMYTKEEAEGKRLKNPFDTITEGIGINRVTRNFMMAELDGAYRGTDREAVEMSRFFVYGVSHTRECLLKSAFN